MTTMTRHPDIVHHASCTASAIAKHEAAWDAWGRASTAAEVAIARDLSRTAAVASCPSARWLEELDAACIDAEADHAVDLHAQAIALLRAPRAER
jgi:hypothetical protein